MNKRIVYLVMMIIFGTFAFSLDKLTLVLPRFVIVYAPNVIWAAMVYLIFALILGKSPIVHFTATFITTFVLGISQMLYIPFLVQIRTSEIGALLIGRGFKIQDLVCYAVGIVICVFVDYVLDALKSA